MKNLSGSEQLQIILINCSIKLTLLRSHKYYPLRDVERNDKDASKPVAIDTLISQIILNNI